MADLLDYIAERLHCPCLSDLRYCKASLEQERELLAIPDEAFELEDYQKALDYLSGGAAPKLRDFSSARQALAATFHSEQGEGRADMESRVSL